MTARFLAKVRGNTQLFSVRVIYPGVFMTEISLWLGTEDSPDDFVSEFDWGKEFPKFAERIDLACEIRAVVAKGAQEGAELWTLHPSTMYRRFLRGEYKGQRIWVITWDSSPSRYAGLVRWWAHGSDGHWNLEELLEVGTWPAGKAADHQPQREALGACLVLDGAAMLLDLSCWAILFRNDAQAAIAAITKGSFHSPEMQRCTIRVHRRLFGQGTVGRRSNGRPMDASGTCQV